MDEGLIPGVNLELSRRIHAEPQQFYLQLYGSRQAAKADKKARREERRKGKMQQRNESVHKMVFERLDKEMRKIPADKVETHRVMDSEGLSKDVYPYSSGVAKIIRKFDLPDKFFYAHVDDEHNWTAHFTINREEDQLSHIERAVSISVIIVR